MHIATPLMSVKTRQSCHCILSFCSAILCLKMCVRGGSEVPQGRGGGGGGGSLGNRPPEGGGGPSSLGWGRTRGAGGTIVKSSQVSLCLMFLETVGFNFILSNHILAIWGLEPGDFENNWWLTIMLYKSNRFCRLRVFRITGFFD